MRLVSLFWSGGFVCLFVVVGYLFGGFLVALFCCCCCGFVFTAKNLHHSLYILFQVYYVKIQEVNEWRKSLQINLFQRINTHKHASQKAVSETEVLQTQERTVQTFNKFCIRKQAKIAHTIPKHYLFIKCCVCTAGNQNKRITNKKLSRSKI